MSGIKAFCQFTAVPEVIAVQSQVAIMSDIKVFFQLTCQVCGSAYQLEKAAILVHDGAQKKVAAANLLLEDLPAGWHVCPAAMICDVCLKPKS